MWNLSVLGCRKWKVFTALYLFKSKHVCPRAAFTDQFYSWEQSGRSSWESRSRLTLWEHWRKSWSSERDSGSRGRFFPEAPVPPSALEGFFTLRTICATLRSYKLFLCLQWENIHTKEKLQQAHSRAHGHTALSVFCAWRHLLRKSTLQDHLNIHSGDWPYKCHCCDMDFKHKSALKKHLTSLHSRSSGEKLARHDLERQNLL